MLRSSGTWPLTIYRLLVGLGGLGVLAWELVKGGGDLVWLPIAVYAGLSLVVQSSHFHLGSDVRRSLADLIDVASVLALGPTAGATVAASSGLAYPIFDALRRRKVGRRDLIEMSWFQGGLGALVALLGGALYAWLGGSFPLSDLNLQTAVPVGVLCLAWFFLDHLGWGVWDCLEGGLRRLRRVLGEAFPQDLLAELLLLPLGALMALVYGRLGWLAFGLLALFVVAVGLLAGHWAHVRKALMQRVAELSTIEQVGRAIAGAELDVDALCRLIYEHARQIVDTTIFHLGLFDGDDYRLKLWMREGKPEPQRSFRLEPNQGLVGWLRRSNEPILVRDFPKELGSLPARPIYVSEHPPRSALFVPLVAGETVIGTLSTQSFRPNAYGESDLRVLSAMANEAAVAIQKAQMHEAERQQAWLSTALLQVADTMGRVSDMDAVLTTVVRLTPMLAGVDRCAILLWDPNTETFAPGQSHGLGEAFEQMRFQAGIMPALDLVRLERKPLVVDAARDELLVPPDLAETLAIREMLLLPLLAQGELLGVMVVDYAEAHPFGERLVEMLAGIANQAAIVLHTARLVEAQREEAYVSMALLQVAEAVNRAGDLEETLERVARITPMLVGVEACVFFLWDGESGAFRPVQQYGLKGEKGRAFWQLQLTEEHPIVRGLGTGEPYVDLQDLEKGSLVADAAFQMALPLVSRGATLGIMGVGCTDPTRRLSQRWLGFLGGIAGQAAMAVENARLQREAAERERMEQELEMAQRIQVSFLPESCPLLPGWDLASIWRSARQVGGDFYDFIPLPDGRLGLVIADVADKGVPAALFMALSRTLVRTVAIDGRSPAAAIARANDLIVADARSDLFVTLFYAILEPRSGAIAYVNAGHVPPLLVRAADGAMEELRLSAMALGVLPDIEVEEERVCLDPGDALVLATDGIVEAFDAGRQMFGWDRLAEVACAHRRESAEALAEAIDQAVALFVGDAAQSDDLTLLVAKREA
jgi:serine phosphatase RsbU (regulator of sigma subunit)/putative methionine-R-sulfoxide reductase with GAF domain